VTDATDGLQQLLYRKIHVRQGKQQQIRSNCQLEYYKSSKFIWF